MSLELVGSMMSLPKLVRDVLGNVYAYEAPIILSAPAVLTSIPRNPTQGFMLTHIRYEYTEVA